MAAVDEFEKFNVHCRTGSLEKREMARHDVDLVHCRTGSLEKLRRRLIARHGVHCRTGSLENIPAPTPA